MKDVTLPDNPASKTLLLEKHADYIVTFEKDKDDLVRHVTLSLSFSPYPSPPTGILQYGVPEGEWGVLGANSHGSHGPTSPNEQVRGGGVCQVVSAPLRWIFSHGTPRPPPLVYPQCHTGDAGHRTLSLTLSPSLSLKVLVLYDCVDVVDVEAVVKFVKDLQKLDGSFIGDKWGASPLPPHLPTISLSIFR